MSYEEARVGEGRQITVEPGMSESEVREVPSDSACVFWLPGKAPRGVVISYQGDEVSVGMHCPTSFMQRYVPDGEYARKTELRFRALDKPAEPVTRWAQLKAAVSWSRVAGSVLVGLPFLFLFSLFTVKHGWSALAWAGLGLTVIVGSIVGGVWLLTREEK